VGNGAWPWPPKREASAGLFAIAAYGLEFVCGRACCPYAGC